MGPQQRLYGNPDPNSPPYRTSNPPQQPLYGDPNSPSMGTPPPQPPPCPQPALTVRCELVTVTVPCSPREMLGSDGDV